MHPGTTTPGTEPHLDLLLTGGSVVGLADGPLLDRMQAGDGPTASVALQALMARHGVMVTRVCRGILGDSHAAEDALQAVFLVLIRRAHAIRDPDRLASWLYGVALRTARAARRHRRLEPTPIVPREETTMIDPTPDPAQTAIRREQAALLHAAITRLPRRYLDPVVLCDLAGLTHTEAADRLHCPPSTVSIRLQRARAQLRSKLARHRVDFETALPPAVALGSISRTLAASPAAHLLAHRVAWTLSAAKWQVVAVAVLLAGVGVGVQAHSQVATPAPQPPSVPVTPTVPPPDRQAPAEPKPAVTTAPPKAPKPEETTPAVKVGLPSVRQVGDKFLFSGRVVAARTVVVRPLVSQQVIAAEVAEGDLVQRDQVLFKLGDLAASAKLREERKEVELDLKKARERLRKIGVDTKFSGDPAELKARDEVARLLSSLGGLTQDRDHGAVAVIAPFAGQVARRSVDVGDTVEAGMTPLATIIAVDPIRVDFAVEQKKYLEIQRWLRSKPGMTHLPVEVRLFDESKFAYSGRVLFRAVQFDPVSKQCTLQAEVANPEGMLVPGLSAWAEVEYGEPQSMVLIPGTAFLKNANRPLNQTGEESLPDNNTSVLVVADDGSVQPRWIKVGLPVGLPQDGLWQVLRGLDAQTRIVLSGEMAGKLQPGTIVAEPLVSPK